MKLHLVAALTLVCACGHSKDKRSSDDDSADPEAGAAGDAVVAPVSGAQPGMPGRDGMDGATGAAGATGATGPSGAKGDKGDRGADGGIALYDANDQQIGVKFSDDDGTVAHVMLPGGNQAFLDRDTGDLRAPFGFFCMYESLDCTGACYVYDSRWLGVVVQDVASQTWVAGVKATNMGQKTIHSYVGDTGACIVNSLNTLQSYQATAYSSPSLVLPLAAPLYWNLTR